MSTIDTAEPTSDADAVIPEPPDSPEGYGEAVQFSYPPVMLAVGSLVLFALAFVGFAELMTALQPTANAEYTVDPTGMAVIAVLFGATIVVHELVHGLAYRLLGYRVTYGIALNIGAAYAAAFGQYQTRRDNLLVALAPLVVFTVVLTPLLAGPFTVALAAFLVLVVNTGGAIGDLYLAWRLLRMPEGTLLYDVDARHSYIFYPE